jgi:dTDP-4-amino-4,6-dideoxygalactose transaminase
MTTEQEQHDTHPTFDSMIPMVRPVLPKYDDLCAGVNEILESGMVTKGHYLTDFEEAVAAHLGVKHAVAVSSCTTGLMLTYRALGLTGDVVVPSFTFMATVSSLMWAGLRPVFVDVDIETGTLDPSEVENAITPDTTAIVAVHNFGNPAEIKALQAVADQRHLKLVFDAAHGFGALYQGRPLGPQGDAQVFSLSPTKLLIAGEGGMVVTNDDRLAEWIRIGREYGNNGHYDSLFPGINARMPEFNALLGLHSLDLLESAAQRRNEVASLYRRELGEVPGIGFQCVRMGNRSSYKDFSVTVEPDSSRVTRDQLQQALTAAKIDTRTYYDPPVHRHLAYQKYAPACSLTQTDRLARASLSLPIWSHMNDETVLHICRAVKSVYP